MEALALALTVVVHIVGLAALVGVLLHNDDIGWRDIWPGDDDGGRPRRPDPPPPLPLPDAEQARARLREGGRLQDAYPRPERRPAREPARDPQRV